MRLSSCSFAFRSWVLALLLTLLGAAGCATLGGANYYSVEQEWELGRQLEAQLSRELRLVNDAQLTRYVNDLGQQLARQTELGNQPWRFYVVQDRAINAFNVPGGLVYVNTGLIAQAGSASELAGVIGHELAHGARRHGTRRLSRANELSVVAGAVLGRQPGIAQQIAAQIAAQGAFASFSRADEREADRLAVRYMARAGYDPEGLARMFERLAEQERAGGVAFFRSHPFSAERVTAVRAEARQVQRSGLRTNDNGFAAARQRAQRY
ncbi:MAG: M48 family metallopeptidase [Rubricoccaceae bacterium]